VLRASSSFASNCSSRSAACTTETNVQHAIQLLHVSKVWGKAMCYKSPSA
jgi:hypothetical protein